MAGKCRNNFACMVFIQGRLTRDPELKYTQAGKAILNFDIARDKRTKVNGNWESKPNYHSVKMFGDYAEAAAAQLFKGCDVQIEGELDQDTWQDKATGANRRKDVIIARSVKPMAWPEDDADSAPRGGYSGSGPVPADQYRAPATGGNTGYRPPPAAAPVDDDYIPEDDIPF
jgi:single-strand DNA-binding protein